MKCLSHIHLPVAAEGVPGVVLDWAHERRGAGVQHERLRPVLLEE
jgi:hypothetical protein